MQNQPTMTLKTYQASGKISPLAILIFLGVLLLIIPLLATLYAYAIWYIPIPYINFFITAAFGIAVGWIINFLVIKYGKVRSGKIASLFAILGAIFAIYFHWAVWVDLAYNISGSLGDEDLGVAVSNISISETIGLALSPSTLMEIMGSINENGLWGFGDTPVRGTFLTIIWIIEALIIFFLAWMGGTSQANKPFCEESNQWFGETKLAPFDISIQPQELIDSLTSGNLEAFQGLQKSVNPKESSHYDFVLYQNETNENYLTLKTQIAKADKDGKISLDETTFGENISITEELSNMLMSK